MPEYELLLNDASTASEKGDIKGLTSATLLNNAHWFIILRWVIAGVFVLTGIAGWLVDEKLAAVDIIISKNWFWILAGGLVLLNAAYILHLRQIESKNDDRFIRINIWIQIAFDLLFISILVHIIGSLGTFISFAYLFHITLACIFFPPRHSLLVTSIAAAMFCATVALELTGVLPETSAVFTGTMINQARFVIKLLYVLSALIIWFVVWYMVSTLSGAVRARDQKLSIANDMLVKADHDKNTQMLVTTHDLKAPFAGIESNIQVLKYQYWDDLSEEVRNIIDRIDNRAHMLRDRINAILVLGELKSKGIELVKLENIDLGPLIQNVADTLKERAAGRNVTLNIDVPAIKVMSDREQLHMLIANLVANGISYSFEGNTVDVYARGEHDGVKITIRDHGIGIREDALPHIFEDYFRSKEASKFNRQSTGLGLSVVKAVVNNLSLRLAVSSEQNKGTTFIILIPKI